MSVLAPDDLMTTDELLALPDDGIERELSRGQLREWDVTQRSRRHTRAGANLTYFLRLWRASQTEPHGEVLNGEASFRLRRDPDTTVGIDVAYISPQTAAENPDDEFTIDGIPVVAAEILSASDTQSKITDKVKDYLDAGVPLVWIAEPVFRTITVYRPDAEPELFNSSQQLTGGKHLPGFSVLVDHIFR